jgi:hypothetical protein
LAKDSFGVLGAERPILTISVFSNPGMSLNGEFEAGSADGSFSG